MVPYVPQQRMARRHEELLSRCFAELCDITTISTVMFSFYKIDKCVQAVAGGITYVGTGFYTFKMMLMVSGGFSESGTYSKSDNSYSGFPLG